MEPVTSTSQLSRGSEREGVSSSSVKGGAPGGSVVQSRGTPAAAIGTDRRRAARTSSHGCRRRRMIRAEKVFSDIEVFSDIGHLGAHEPGSGKIRDSSLVRTGGSEIRSDGHAGQ